MRAKPIPYKPIDTVYKPDDIGLVIGKAINREMTRGNRHGVRVYNVPCSFDIETTSFYVDEHGNALDYGDARDCDLPKRACMYVWQFGLNGYVIVGRTWGEYLRMLATLCDMLGLGEKKRLIVYVHNLQFEFQFLRKWHQWEHVFSMDNRKPIYARTVDGIEYRCSYILSGYSLQNLGSHLIEYPISKMVGDLDYGLLRHSKTPLDSDEIKYCINDVQVVMSYINDCINTEGTINRIPLTKTGYVRRYCRDHTLKIGRKRDIRYRECMDNLRIDTLHEFSQVRRAFMGGFTHANPCHACDVLQSVTSYDFTSSYPYVLLAERFPMSKGTLVTVHDMREFEDYLSTYCCVFDVVFKDLNSIKIHEHYISYSKCIDCIDPVLDNGRVVNAEYLKTTITNVDYEIIRRYYTWTEIHIKDFRIYKRGYLPKQLIECILKFYEDKTTLKGVRDKELEYMQGKAMLNSIYGMCVTNPMPDTYEIDSDGVKWSHVEYDDNDKQSMLDDYNDSDNRFLYYLWGVFCTAYARYNLFTAITTIGDDYVYSDTDSVKILNADKYKAYFDAYDKVVVKKLEKAAKVHNISFERFAPKNIHGVAKPIGVWDCEGTYTYFKTLGAKRYAYVCDKAITIDGVDYPISITVSGVNKRHAIPYLWEISNHNPQRFIYEIFNDGMHIPEEYTGKLTHTYIDDIQMGKMIDYMGNEYEYLELSSIHLEPSSYDMGLIYDYIAFLKGLREEVL